MSKAELALSLDSVLSLNFDSMAQKLVNSSYTTQLERIRPIWQSLKDELDGSGVGLSKSSIETIDGKLVELQKRASKYLSKAKDNPTASAEFKHIVSQVSLAIEAAGPLLHPETVAAQQQGDAKEQKRYKSRVRKLAKDNLILRTELETTFTHFLKELEDWIDSLPNGKTPGDIFISYSWPQDGSEEAKWLQPFLRGVCDHLQTLGLTVHLDIKRQYSASSTYQYMHNHLNESEFVVLFGTESMLYKHLNSVSMIHSELAQMKRMRADAASHEKRLSVICINLSSNFQKAFPAEYEGYATVTDWLENDYMFNICELAAELYGLRNNKEYQQKWKTFRKSIAQQGYQSRIARHHQEHPDLPYASSDEEDAEQQRAAQALALKRAKRREELEAERVKHEIRPLEARIRRADINPAKAIQLLRDSSINVPELFSVLLLKGEQKNKRISEILTNLVARGSITTESLAELFPHDSKNDHESDSEEDVAPPGYVFDRIDWSIDTNKGVTSKECTPKADGSSVKIRVAAYRPRSFEYGSSTIMTHRLGVFYKRRKDNIERILNEEELAEKKEKYLGGGSATPH